MLIYVAHPFGGKQENKDKVEKIILRLTEQFPDYTFLSPIHATGFYYFNKSYDNGMKDCIEMLKRCDELWLCEGWEDSKGCNIERDWAIENGMKIGEINDRP